MRHILNVSEFQYVIYNQIFMSKKCANFKSLHPYCHKLGASNFAYKTLHIKQPCDNVSDRELN